MKKIVPLIVSISVLVIIVLSFIFSPPKQSDNISGQEQNQGRPFSVNVSNPFLFTVLSDLTQGTNANITLSDSPNKEATFNYSLFKEDKSIFFKNVKTDVILYGENELHQLKLIDYTNPTKTYTVPAGYAEREKQISSNNYFMNIKNGEVILNEIFEDIKDYNPLLKQNYERITNELSNVQLLVKDLGSDYSNPAIFYVGETDNIAWLQSLNSKIKIVSLKDSNIEKYSDTYEMFLAAIKLNNITTIVSDKSIDPEIIALLRKNVPGLRINYLQNAEIADKTSIFYKNNISIISDSLVNLP